MSKLAPKPIIAGVIQTWNLDLGMKIALVEDMECQAWIVESCPAGTHFWTLAQARSLSHTGRVGAAIRAALSVAQNLPAAARQTRRQVTVPAPCVAAPTLMPVATLPRRQQDGESELRGIVRPIRRASRRPEKVAVCS